jgi:hypothetical protein
MDENDDVQNFVSPPDNPQPGESRGDRARRAQAAREAERRDKAAAKLRENLMRRKGQARARRAGDADETIGLPAANPSAAKSDESS